MKWRDTDYNAQYVVKRICRELGADPVEVWEIMDEEFDKEPGESMTPQEAADLEEIVLAGLRAAAPAAAKNNPDEYLTRPQAAALLKMHVSHLDELRRMGKISYVQHMPGGRVLISRKAINDFLTRSMHKALPQRCLRETYRKRRVV